MTDYVVFFPQTGVTRIFESYNMAETYYPSMPIYVRPIGLLADLPPGKLESAYDALVYWADQRGSLADHDGVLVARDRLGVLEMPVERMGVSRSDLAKKMWDLMLLVGNRISKPVKIGNESGSSKGFMLNLEEARNFRDRIRKGEDRQPRQVLAMLDFFIEQSFDFYTRTEIRRLCNSSEFYRNLKTKQDGWRIFRYYKGVLVENGVLAVSE